MLPRAISCEGKRLSCSCSFRSSLRCLPVHKTSSNNQAPNTQLQFSEEDVSGVRAEFLGRTYYDWPDEYEPRDPSEVYGPPEGKVILLFTKPA
jgi:hypothetical protein